MSKVYELGYDELRGIANLCWQEQGSTVGAAAEASLMCNLYELRNGKSSHGSLYNYVRNCGWWARAGHWMDNGEASDQVIAAVAEVVMNGNRALPEYVDEHDCFSDIESISTGDVYDRSAYIKDKTAIKNRYGSTYTFYCFPAPGSDPFGYTSKPSGSETAEVREIIGASNVIESAISWMEEMANDDSHGYDQRYRWGEKGDYDCSAAVITAWDQAGVPVKDEGATYTGDMREAFLKCGFKDVTETISLADGDGLERGDVLLNEERHVAMYCGDGREVEACINEIGTATGGAPGDQTGREFLIRPYRSYPWNCVLRYEGDDAMREGSFEDVRLGDTGTDVYLMQVLLRGRGYKGKDKAPLERDGDAGVNTIYALKKFQKKKGLEADGICGTMTWKYLLWDTGD